MKIAQITYSTKPRGGVVHTLALSEALAARGHDVEIWTLGRDADTAFFRAVDPAVTVRVVPFESRDGEDVGARIERSIQTMAGEFSSDADIVHAQDCISANAVITAGLSCVRTIHHLDAFTTPRLIECHETAIHRPAARICVSRAVAAEVSEQYGYDPVVIPNGVDAQRFVDAAGPAGADRRGHWRSRFGDYVLALGGIEPRKGSIDLLEAFALLRASRPELRLVFGGGETLFDYRPYREEFERRALALDIRPEILGALSDDELPALMAAARALGFVSTKEGFGLAAMEALAAGVPVVARDLPVVREVFGDAVTYANDVEGIADALARVTDAAPPSIRAQGAGSPSRTRGPPPHAHTRTSTSTCDRGEAVLVRQTISSIFSDRAAANPDEVVVVDERGEVTAGELEESATRLARELRARGVQVDDLVVVALPNGRDFVIACAAIWKAGATPQPVALTLTDAERSAVESVARPTAAIGIRPRTPGIGWLPSVESSADAGAPLPDLAASSWKAPTSSGSTGAPKVVKSSAPALMDPTRPVAAFLPVRGTQLVAGPMSHSATFTYAFRGLLTGQRLVILPRFDERAWLDAVERHAVSWALVVPTMMHRLLRLPEEERDVARLTSIESVLHMGAPCSVELKRSFLSWLGSERVVEVYAGSESNGLTMIRGEEWLARPGSVGRPIGGTEIEIRTDRGVEAAAGETGVVWMRRGERPSYAYLGATSQRDYDGWDTLGDVGRIDAEGFLFLVDRADDVINRGGEKIYPIEIERVLEQHPSVRGAVAFGVDDESLGQRVEAVVDIAESSIEGAELEAWGRARLGPRAPTAISIVREPVRNDAGKTSRKQWSAKSRLQWRG